MEPERKLLILLIILISINLIINFSNKYEDFKSLKAEVESVTLPPTPSPIASRPSPTQSHPSKKWWHFWKW